MLAIILGTAVLTFLIRYLPLAVLHEKKLPLAGERFLYYLPLGILGALAMQSVFLREGQLYSGLPDFYLLGAIASIALAIITRNLAIVIAVGIGAVALATFVAGLLA